MNSLNDLKSRLQSVKADAPITLTLNGETLTMRADVLAAPLGIQTQPAVTISPITTRIRVIAPNGVNLRAAPGRNAARLTSVPLNEVMDWFASVPPVPLDGESWIQVRQTSTQLTGFCAQRFVETVVIPAVDDTIGGDVPKPPPTRPHLIGLHILQGGVGGEAVVNMAQRMSVAGRPLAAVTVVNDRALAGKLAAVVPYVVFRDVQGDGNADNPLYPDDADEQFGYGWMAKLWPRYEALDPRVYLQPLNECLWHPKDGLFWVGVMNFLEEKGRHAAIIADAVGNPSDDRGLTRTQKWQKRLPALQRAKANGHIVSLHVYSAPNTPAAQLSGGGLAPYFEFRYRDYYASVPADARPPLVFTEAAREFYRGKFDGIPNTLRWARTLAAEMSKDEYVAGLCLWTVGNAGGWTDACIDSALPEIERAFISV